MGVSLPDFVRKSVFLWGALFGGIWYLPALSPAEEPEGGEWPPITCPFNQTHLAEVDNAKRQLVLLRHDRTLFLQHFEVGTFTIRNRACEFAGGDEKYLEQVDFHQVAADHHSDMEAFSEQLSALFDGEAQNPFDEGEVRGIRYRQEINFHRSDYPAAYETVVTLSDGVKTRKMVMERSHLRRVWAWEEAGETYLLFESGSCGAARCTASGWAALW